MVPTFLQKKVWPFTQLWSIGWKQGNSVTFHSLPSTISMILKFWRWHYKDWKNHIQSSPGLISPKKKNWPLSNKLMTILMKLYPVLKDIYWLKECSNKFQSHLWTCTVIWSPLMKSTHCKKSQMLILTSIYGMKLTRGDFSRTGSNQLITNLHHCWFINIVKESTTCMEFGTLHKGNLLYLCKLDLIKFMKKLIWLCWTDCWG